MAKRYYWLKLPKDFFEDKAIKRLRQIAGGDTYTIIYLKMLLKSMEDDGKLFYEGIEDTICDEIALDINENADDVQVTISYLEKKGLLIVTDSEVELTRLTEMVGSESAVTERVRKHREAQKLLQCNASVLQGNTIETKCNTEKEIEKSREDTETDTKKKKKSAKADLDGMINSFTENEELREALKAFLDMRKSIKKPIQTEYAFKLALNKLKQLSDIDSIRIEIVNQSVEHNWRTFYTLQNNYKSNEVEMPDYMKKQEKGDIVSTPVNEDTLAKALELQRQFKGK